MCDGFEPTIQEQMRLEFVILTLKRLLPKQDAALVS